MFGFKGVKKDEAPIKTPSVEPAKGWLGRLKNGLKKTREHLFTGLSELIGKNTIDVEVLESLEEVLLLADVGVEATDHILDSLKQAIDRKMLKDGPALLEALRVELLRILLPCTQAMCVTRTKRPFSLLMVGVNGAGKTTSIAKLGHFFKSQGHSVMLAAGDTFRAAAVEQLQVWGERNKVPVIAQKTGSDSASVIFDAMQAASAKGVDVLIADTAGRLHTQSHLMQELEKIKRVMGKKQDGAPHETMLVLDSGVGQNGLQQAEAFHKALSVDSLCITKLDGTAKGGVVIAIAQKLKIPIRFIGVGERLEDLRPFDAKAYVDALLTPVEG